MLINSNEYKEALNEALECIKAAQYSAVVSANHALLHRNWRIGKIITEKSQWGNKFIDSLAADIRREFPQTTGFSVRNLKYMKKFSGLFTEDDIDQMGFAGLTWYHHMALMDKTGNREHYLWYLSKAIENGWTRDVLAMQIDTGLYDRQNAPKIQNFAGRLPDKQSEIGKNQLSRIENGRENCTIPQLLVLVQVLVLECSVDYILFGKKPYGQFSEEQVRAIERMIGAFR